MVPKCLGAAQIDGLRQGEIDENIVMDMTIAAEHA